MRIHERMELSGPKSGSQTSNLWAVLIVTPCDSPCLLDVNVDEPQQLVFRRSSVVACHPYLALELRLTLRYGDLRAIQIRRK